MHQPPPSPYTSLTKSSPPADVQTHNNFHCPSTTGFAPWLETNLDNGTNVCCIGALLSFHSSFTKFVPVSSGTIGLVKTMGKAKTHTTSRLKQASITAHFSLQLLGLPEQELK
mmetsp:Transcript_25417/g.70211  ORF Transcript_25417/g.70211 Transcript_25417/m.70211 type:complete len:113 (-) Transcript_25417:1859-2197(-)